MSREQTGSPWGLGARRGAVRRADVQQAIATAEAYLLKSTLTFFVSGVLRIEQCEPSPEVFVKNRPRPSTDGSASWYYGHFVVIRSCMLVPVRGMALCSWCLGIVCATWSLGVVSSVCTRIEARSQVSQAAVDKRGKDCIRGRVGRISVSESYVPESGQHPSRPSRDVMKEAARGSGRVTGRRGGLARGLGRELLAGRLATGGLASGLLGTSHCFCLGCW